MRPLPIHPPRVLPLPLQAAVVILACILLFWVGIASSGFNQSEGFRVFPAYEMLDSGDWVVPRLFGQAYLRKPPGVPWAIALFSELLGRTEFAARATCAYAMTLSCLATLLASWRWFGPRFSLLAALAHALTPLFWYSARSAEIEAINNLFTQLCVFAIIEAILTTRPARAFSPIACLWIALGTAGLLLCKGPASLPCVAGALLACAIVQRRISSAINPYALASLALGCVPFFVWLYLATARSKGLDPVTQTPGRFLWDSQHLVQTIFLVPRGWASALPWSFVLLVPLVVRRTSHHTPSAEDSVAKAVALGSLFALLIYTATGINNVRYAMPALTTFFPLIAWFWSRTLGPNSLAISPPRAARAWQLSPLVVLALAAGIWLPMEEARRDRNSGRSVGRQLGSILPDHSVVYGDLMFDTRPEVFFYAVRCALERGNRVACYWVSQYPQDGERFGFRHSPPSRSMSMYLVIRTDDRDEFNHEWSRFVEDGFESWARSSSNVFEGSIQGGKFTFIVLKHRIMR